MQLYVEDLIKPSDSSVGVGITTESAVTVKIRDRRVLVTVGETKEMPSSTERNVSGFLSDNASCGHRVENTL